MFAARARLMCVRMWVPVGLTFLCMLNPVLADGGDDSGDSKKSKWISVDVSLYLVSEYMSQGYELSDGVAAQPYVELGYRDFYLAADASNGSQRVLGARDEIDYYIGYRGMLGDFLIDTSYGYYTFEGVSFARDYGEFRNYATYAVTDSFSATAYAGYAPDYFDQLDLSLTLDYVTSISGLDVSVTYGQVDTGFGDWSYYHAGFGYEVSHSVAISVMYWGADDPSGTLGLTDGIVVGTIVFNYNIL